jgi:hypothetical protein
MVYPNDVHFCGPNKQEIDNLNVLLHNVAFTGARAQIGMSTCSRSLDLGSPLCTRHSCIASNL